MVSPEVQTHAITTYCTARGYRLVDLVEGIDESGSQAASGWWRKLDAAVDAVEDGTYDVVVVWKYHRTARHRRRWAVAVDRIETAGGRIESATEQVDTSTSTGRFTRGMLAELAAFEAERIGDVWKEVQDRRVRNGQPHNGRPRFGYTYSKVDGYQPDPATDDTVRAAYARYIAGEGFYSIARWLNSAGHRTTTGALWTDGTLRRYLDSGFAAGFFHFGGDRKRGIAPTRHEGTHKPLIDADTWATYLSVREERGRLPARRRASPYLLSGLARCGWCGASMNGGQHGANRVAMYRCETRRATAGTGCRGGYVSAARVHAAVLDWLETIASEVEQAADEAAEQAARAHDTTAEDARRIEAEIERLERALVRLVQSFAEGDVDGDAYKVARGDYERRLTTLREMHAACVRTANRLSAPPAATAAPLAAEWDTLPVESRRELLRALVARVDVWANGRGTPPRVEVVPLWSVSVD